MELSLKNKTSIKGMKPSQIGLLLQLENIQDQDCHLNIRAKGYLKKIGEYSLQVASIAWINRLFLEINLQPEEIEWLQSDLCLKPKGKSARNVIKHLFKNDLM